ncbi:MAG: hypothetical protein ACP5MI_11735 [Candidatus Kryptoniota bacterium]
MMEKIAVILLTIFYSSCKIPIGPDDLLVSSMRFEPPLFDPFKQNTKLSFNLLTPARISVYILDSDHKRVKTIAENLDLTKGSHSIGWKGDTDSYLFVPSGTYIGQIVTEKRKFESTVEVFHW